LTFSIVARAESPPLFGVAIASSSPAVAARCAHARAHVGAAATQNITDPALGPRVLDALAAGADSRAAIEHALAPTAFAAYRQLLAIGAAGPPEVHTGIHALGTVAAVCGADAAAAGNLLGDPRVPESMLAAFERSTGHLGARLLAALRAGLARGGEAGPVHSAGVLVVREVSWPIVDLRVDWSMGDPIAELTEIWEIYAPQIEPYVQRAMDPRHAPRFGVLGEGSSREESARAAPPGDDSLRGP
jgi:uncharacterized Ntn-hydrolase superfamily protein